MVVSREPSETSAQRFLTSRSGPGRSHVRISLAVVDLEMSEMISGNPMWFQLSEYLLGSSFGRNIKCGFCYVGPR